MFMSLPSETVSKIFDKTSRRYVFCISVDDVFVREDLFDGKYAPDMTQHERLMENMKKYGSFLDLEEDNDVENVKQKEEL